MWVVVGSVIYMEKGMSVVRGKLSSGVNRLSVMLRVSILFVTCWLGSGGDVLVARSLCCTVHFFFF